VSGYTLSGSPGFAFFEAIFNAFRRFLSLSSVLSFRSRQMQKLPIRFLSVCLALTAVGYSQSAGPQTQPAEPPGAGRFRDATKELGLAFRHHASPTSKKYLLETMGSGVAAFDYDNDGRLDIFISNGARLDDPMPERAIPRKDGPEYWNRLYHQKSDGTFEDVTEKAGVAGSFYSTGVAVGDYDNDGYEDLFVAGYGRNTLYHNNGDGTFTDVTGSAGIVGSGWSTSAAWVDYDNDGRLDLVVARYMEWDFQDVYCGEHKEGYRSYCHPDIFKPATPLLYHNEGNGKFKEVSAKAGLNKPGKGLGVAVSDYDRDGWMDILIANDAVPQSLFHNKGDGTFEEIGMISGLALDGSGATYSGMGVDFEDYNNDGRPDVVITDLANQKYALYLNGGDGGFNYSATTTGFAGITLLHSGWGVKFIDYDNDGWKDIFVAQAHVMDTIETSQPHLHYREPPLLLHNVAGKKFVDVSRASGKAFEEKWIGRGLATGDLNNDGKVDVVVTSNDGPAWILLNETPGANHWITLDLEGVKSNRDAIGANIKISTRGGSQFATVSTGGSYQSSSDRRVHFGLGPDNVVQRIEIHWPSRIVQTLTNVVADRIVKIREEAAAPK